MLSTNIDSLLNKKSELLKLLGTLEHRPEIIAVSEVLPKNSKGVKLSEFYIPGYDAISNDFDKNNRGIIIYVKSGLSTTIMDIDIKFEEFLVIQIKNFDNRGQNLTFANVYRRPGSTKENNDKLAELLKYLVDSCGRNKLMIVGDFNYPNINWELLYSDNPEEMDFIETLNDNFLSQHVHHPTRARGHDTPHILDLVVTNEDFIRDIEILSPVGKSDHSVLGISIDIKKVKRTRMMKYNFSKADFGGLGQFMNCDWDVEFGECDENVDQMWARFTSKLKEGMNLFIPKQMSFDGGDRYDRPLSPVLRRNIRLKHRAWNIYMKHKKEEDFKNYKKIRNRVTSQIRTNDRSVEEKIAQEVKTNPKKFWKFVNAKCKGRNGIPSIRYQENGVDFVAETDEEKANVLNNYFTSIFNDQKSTGRGVSHEPRLEENCKMDSVILVEENIKSRLKKLNVCKSAGIDNIFPIVLRETADCISYPIARIYESSLKSGTIPQDWKSSNICPIFKKGKRDCAGNYRPVSITCILCKIMEGIIKDHITAYFNVHKLFNVGQYGFIRGRSTTSQLLTRGTAGVLWIARAT